MHRILGKKFPQALSLGSHLILVPGGADEGDRPFASVASEAIAGDGNTVKSIDLPIIEQWAFVTDGSSLFTESSLDKRSSIEIFAKWVVAIMW